MKEIFRALFTFSSLEKRGMLVFGCLLVILTAAKWWTYNKNSHEIPSYPHFRKECQDFERQRINKSAKCTEPSWQNTQHSKTPEFFFFDPNLAVPSDLKRLGLSDRVISNILKYRQKGGQFRTPDDFKKIYGLTKEDFNRLYAWIIIPSNDKLKSKPTEEEILNMNLADSAEFETLPGIGPVLANRIIRYRNLIGGFYSISQLQEVYGVTYSLYQDIRTRLFADSTLITKINVNKAAEDILSRHPYIGRHYAKGIVQYRSTIKPFVNLEELKTHRLIRLENEDKLVHYICF
jgi:DNA uptake protein ComE-like DNA-binding protein